MINILSNIYQAITNKRNQNFDNGKYNIHKVDVPVISVGNLSVGGTGKTPFVIYLANILESKGLKVGVIGRGYGRKSKELVEVSDGFNIKTDTNLCGDEMVLIARKSKAIVVAGQKKWKSAKIITSRYKLDVLLVDDGFQHRHLNRNLDILLIDKDTIKKPYVLPKGRLRESFKNYKRADIIALKGNLSFDDANVNIIKYENQPKSIIPIFQYGENPIFCLLSSIAKPINFHNLVNNENINFELTLTYKDHHSYSKSDINTIIKKVRSRKANSILTTEKDMVKLLKFETQFQESGINLYTLPIETRIFENEELLLNKINGILT